MTTTMTAPPAELLTWLGRHSRKQGVLEHAVRVKAAWWNELLTDLHLPGRVRTDGGFITRQGIFDLAPAARADETGESALELLWHTLAWGSGTDSLRNNKARAAAVAADADEAGRLLRRACLTGLTDPAGAHRTMAPDGDTAISRLGPAFFTKALYFAGAGAPDHPSLIVDIRVLRTLHRELPDEDGMFVPRHGYGPLTYADACQALRAWAESATGELGRGATAGEVGRDVAADEVERWAFEAGRNPA